MKTLEKLLLFVVVFLGLTALDIAMISVYLNDLEFWEWNKQFKVLLIFGAFKNLVIYLTAIIKK